MNRTTRHIRALGLAASAAVLVSAAGCSDDGSDYDISEQFGANPQLPEPTNALLPSMKVAEVVGWQDGETPTVPDGLSIAPYAQNLGNPRTVHTLPNGDVLVVQSKGPAGEPLSRPKDVIRGWIMSFAHGAGVGPDLESNKITLLRDTNRDGTVDDRSDLLTGLDSPFGVAWIDDTLYVAATDGILSYPYRLGESGPITAEPTVLTPLPGGPIDHHWTKDLALSPDGNTLYASVGSNSNIVENGIEAEKGRAAIWQVDRRTGAAKVYASGLRNPNGLTFNPETGQLWAVVNERDELGPNLVPDYMTSVKEGAHYGWPWSYYGDHVDERVMPRRPDMVEKAIAPDYALSSHVAALGLTFSYDSALPEDYRGGAFIGEHGSWNRDHFNGYHVVYVSFEDGKPTGDPKEVVTGFLDGDTARGRPVGVGIDGTGALLVADDAGNTVWRVAASDGATTDAPIGTDRVSMNASASAATDNEGTDGGTANGAGSKASPSAGGTAQPAPDAQGGSATNAAPTGPATGAGASAGSSGAGGQTLAPSPDEEVTGEAPSSSGGNEASPEPAQTDIAPAVLPQGTMDAGSNGESGAGEPTTR